MKSYLIFILAFSFQASAFAMKALPRTAAPKGAHLYFISPKDGEVFKSGDVTVKFGLSGMGVAPAGVIKENTGHHHLLINAEIKDWGLPIGNDENHKHFGGGQTETTLKLASGNYTLQLVLGDHLHIPHKPPVVSNKISIVVK